ncbi:MAG: hypothetical protein ACKVY0_19100 [Prosthecobacter sp.]|uniref:hypothetical protein n=1 Tax=Prosthecobacter sp. TaxID=1965333 RepID=UPI003901E637
MPRDKTDVEGGLTRKGFQPIKPGADHNYFIYQSMAGQKARASTKTSHGKGFDIDDNLLSQMARQCGLTKKQFLGLLDCPLSREDYEKLLKQNGKL